MGVISSCFGNVHSDCGEAAGTNGSKVRPLQGIVNKFKLMFHGGKVEDAAPSNDAMAAPRAATITTTSTTAPLAIAIGHDVPTHQPNPSVNCGNTNHSELQQSIQQVQSLNTAPPNPLANEAGKSEENKLVDSSSKNFEDSLEIFPSSDAEDVCSTCLEEYDEENPKIMTHCNHHFHLPCIYEWMQQSSTCPLCGKLMIFEEMT